MQYHKEFRKQAIVPVEQFDLSILEKLGYKLKSSTQNVFNYRRKKFWTSRVNLIQITLQNNQYVIDAIAVSMGLAMSPDLNILDDIIKKPT